MKRTARAGIWAIVIAIGLFAGMPSHADLRKGNGEVGFDLGLTNFDSDLTGESQGGFRFDLRAGYMFSDLFELEGLIGYSGVDDGDLETAFVDAVFNFRTSPRLMPYFLIGAGGARMGLDSNDDTGLAGQIAGGFRGFGDDGRIGLRLELGAMVLDLFDETTTQVNLTFGFTFGLGRHHAHQAPHLRHALLDE